MKTGFVASCLLDRSWEDTCNLAKDIGLEAIEPFAGGFGSKVHCDPAALLKDDGLLKKFVDAARKNGLEISCLDVHMNPLHPQKSFADKHIADLEAAIELAGRIGTKSICCFAGLPGAGEDALYPNWITYSWPSYFDESIVRWQWEEKIVPFWKKTVKKGEKAGVKFALELHPCDAVYNTETFLKLREEIGAEEIGCTLDFGHFPFLGMDPIVCIKSLGDSIINIHAKEAKIDKARADFTGLLDWKDMEKNFRNRSWNYTNAGYAEGTKYWGDIAHALKSVGYDGVLSIEHEDPLVPAEEGLIKAHKFLDNIISGEKK